MSFVSSLAPLLQRYGFDHYGWARLERPLSMDIYRQWLERGAQASMNYLSLHADQKERPELLAPRARSALVIAQPYLPHPYASAEPVLPGSRTALYSRGEDYHFRFKEDLEKIAAALRMDYLGEEFLCFTDSAPILERDLAYRAGLGWVGKNTCLIHPKKGSLFFLGQILTSLAVDEPASSPLPDACGSCDRCIRACPTGALESPRWLNAGKCIAYWTIEAREPAPEALRPQLQDWLFGCDICQTVCPWNEKHFGKELMQGLTSAKTERELLLTDLRWILESSGRELSRKLSHSPLLRARPAGLKRNALIVIGNQKLSEMRAQVEAAVKIPALKKVAEWALVQLN